MRKIESSDDSIITVEEQPDGTATIKAVSPGAARIGDVDILVAHPPVIPAASFSFSIGAKPLFTLTTVIVGSKFIRGAVAALETIAEGSPLRLMADPENKYDKNAVAVYLGEIHLGFIPRQANAPLSEFLRQKDKFCRCTVVRAAVMDRGRVVSEPRVLIEEVSDGPGAC